MNNSSGPVINSGGALVQLAKMMLILYLVVFVFWLVWAGVHAVGIWREDDEASVSVE